MEYQLMSFIYLLRLFWSWGCGIRIVPNHPIFCFGVAVDPLYTIVGLNCALKGYFVYREEVQIKASNSTFKYYCTL